MRASGGPARRRHASKMRSSWCHPFLRLDARTGSLRLPATIWSTNFRSRTLALRPLTLSVRGIRSYREQHTIDFQGRGLVAIVGDTGAGKSSILEAITYALYNATTWDQRAVTQLISDGAQSMSVDLTFKAGDQSWQVQRACHRSASRPSTHRLRCLSEPGREEFDGEAAVNRQVERLLGMTYKAYLAAVVLPQGRFQTLLQETKARRTEILEGIFRLTDLRSVRVAARDLGQRAEVA